MIDFNQLKNEIEKGLTEIKDAADLDLLRLAYLGRKEGKLNTILKALKDLAEDERKVVGKNANTLRQFLEDEISKKARELAEVSSAARELLERIDITAPSVRAPRGHLHPLTQLIRKSVDIFSSMGFAVVSGPEVETEFYNFDALNVPKDHPARDMQDTFWLQSNRNVSSQKLLLRTHTSSVQIRYMQTHQPPFRLIAPGRVFRNEATDATHEAQFYQLEGLMVGRDVSLANLKAVLEVFFRDLFGDQKLKVRFRPSYFPFVEPGVEMMLSCFKCNPRTERAEQSPYDGNPRTERAEQSPYDGGGKGCALCKKTGWIEMGGAGMVHPKVLEAVKIDPREWRGFAFGLGPDRIAMAKYGIDDIRLFYDNDLRFLKQF